MKIIKQLSEDEFIVKLEDKDKEKNFGCGVSIAHDYVEFYGKSLLYTESSVVINRGKFSSNTIPVFKSLQIPIKSMYSVILPLLKNNLYLQDEHFKDRQYDEDDIYYTQNGKDKPRYLKGDIYPVYSYYNQIVHYYKDGIRMVAFSMKGEKQFNHVTLKFFNEYVLPNLNK